MNKSPVYNIKAVPVEKIVANDYNPNTVASPEMKLLYDSIKEDGYTMPIVCYYDKDKDQYIIVDGFHRYRIIKEYPDILTVDEMSKALGVSTKTGYQLLRENKIEHLKVGRAYKVPKAHLLSYLRLGLRNAEN